MKKFSFLLFFSLLLFFSCSLDNNSTSNTPTQYKLSWHLIETTGGIGGVDDLFEPGTVVWSFNENTGTLTVDNQNTEYTKEDFLDSGTYTYSIDPNPDNTDYFITIDDVEYGKIIIGSNKFTIDENQKSTGTSTDGFIYTFQKVVTPI